MNIYVNMMLRKRHNQTFTDADNGVRLCAIWGFIRPPDRRVADSLRNNC